MLGDVLDTEEELQLLYKDVNLTKMKQFLRPLITDIPTLMVSLSTKEPGKLKKIKKLSK